MKSLRALAFGVPAVSQDVVLLDHPIVSLPAGNYRCDRLTVDGSDTYLRLRGVQYARHPVGDLRWQPTKAFPDFKDIADATSFGKDCLQSTRDQLMARQIPHMSEECLFLNLWVPEVDKTQKTLPILFWIHGGAFVGGSPRGEPGDGMMLVRRDSILVTSNYRLGALGFLAGDAMKRSTHDGSAGNFALQDNRMALQWVKRNIAPLGGDAAHVTIFGQSSGASQVTTHMVMPRSAGLFNGAIGQSGAWDNFTIQYIGWENANFHEFSKLAGCDAVGDDDAQLVCLRNRPMRTLFGGDLSTAIAETATQMLWGPTVDGVELVDVPENLASQGLINPVDAVMFGTTRNEARFMMPLTMAVPNGPFSEEADFQQWVHDNLPLNVDEILSLYSAKDYDDNWWYTAAALYTDQQYTCPALRSAKWVARSTNATTFVYQLGYSSEQYRSRMKGKYWRDYCTPFLNTSHWNHHILRCPERQVDVGVGHAADVGFVFPFKVESPDDGTMTEAMIGWWQSFASTQNPTIAGSTSSPETLVWDPVSTANQTMYLHPQESGAIASNRERFCEFWDRQHQMPYNSASVVVV